MQLVDLSDVVAAIDHAKSIKIDAFVLGRGAMFRALERAGDRGADVRIAFADAGDVDAGTLADLHEHGVRVVDGPKVGPDSIHAKIAVIDDRVFYDDRNWRSSQGHDIIIRSDIDETTLASDKAHTIADEATLVRFGPGHDVLVATESFGPGPVADALLERAQRGDDVRLVYNPFEMTRGRDRVLAALRQAGVRIAVSDANHKFACTGDRAWVGSANATLTAGQTGAGLEWGKTLSGKLAAGVHAEAERLWHEADSSLHGDTRARG